MHVFKFSMYGNTYHWNCIGSVKQNLDYVLSFILCEFDIVRAYQVNTSLLLLCFVINDYQLSLLLAMGHLYRKWNSFSVRSKRYYCLIVLHPTDPTFEKIRKKAFSCTNEYGS